MTIANFKTMMLSWVNRTDLTAVNGQDLLLLAINDARLAAQRSHLFELNRTEDCYIQTSTRGANWMTGCVTAPTGGAAMTMLRIDEVWNYSELTIDATATYQRAWPRIPFDYSGRFKREFGEESWPSNTVVSGANQNRTSLNKFAYAIGPKLYVNSVTSATWFKLVGIQLLPDLTDGSSPDIFLTYYVDWLKHATLAAMNVYLKDSERFAIDAVLLTNLFNSVKQHDGTINNMGESVNLD